MKFSPKKKNFKGKSAGIRDREAQRKAPACLACMGPRSVLALPKGGEGAATVGSTRGPSLKGCPTSASLP